MVSNYDAFRGQLTRLLDPVDEENLARTDLDALATGIRVARRTGDALALPTLARQQPRAFEFGQRILDQLHDGDKELSSDEVAKLNALVSDRLPVLF